jgi:hypothetical protein
MFVYFTASETTSSSDTSSLSSDSTSEESDSDEDLDDSKLLLEVRKQMEKQVKVSFPKITPSSLKNEEICNNSVQEEKEDKDNDCETIDQVGEDENNKELASNVDSRLKDIPKDEKQQSGGKKRRIGLVHEIMISVSMSGNITLTIQLAFSGPIRFTKLVSKDQSRLF